MRKECLTECSKLLDTHELTLAEKDCAKSCFRKYGYAYHNFSNLVHKQSYVLNNWDDFKKRYKIDPNDKLNITPLIEKKIENDETKEE